METIDGLHYFNILQGNRLVLELIGSYYLEICDCQASQTLHWLVCFKGIMLLLLGIRMELPLLVLIWAGGVGVTMVLMSKVDIVVIWQLQWSG